MKPYEHFTILEWLTYLEKRHAQEIQLGLDRVRIVGEILGLLTSKALVVTVAGTNGKGSIVASLEAIYKTAGYQVGSYTSPHLISFNERIKINSNSISDECLHQSFLAVEVARGEIPLTYFETATLAALWYFKQHPLDLIILEVGMGGRLDATNVIDADLAIISTIDLDHQAFLGENREAIGYEKAGILRKKRPCVIAEHNPPHSVISYAEQLNCDIYRLGKEYNFQLTEKGFVFSFKEEKLNCSSLPENLHPQSLAAAVTAGFLMRNRLLLTHFNLIEGLKHSALAGRLQWVSARQPFVADILLDVSHNPQSVNYLSYYLTHKLPLKPFTGRIHAVFSALKDKDIEGLVTPLLEIVDYWYPALLEGVRAASCAQLASALCKYGIMKTCFKNPLVAFQAAYQNAIEGDLIVIYGSFYTVGTILPYISHGRDNEIDT